MRKIIHIDMDAFYASVEVRDNPIYEGRAIAVGGSPQGRGGVVATCSYEARRYGVRSAMPSKQALQLCPDLIFVRPRFDAYKAVSQQVREIFHRYTDLVQPLSLDEAYLDVTVDKKGMNSALDIAKEIKASIKSELSLTASAGVSVNKFVAKIASDLRKPDGLTFIGPSSVEKFIEELSVEKFFGVGKVTAERMRQLGIYKGIDLKRFSEEALIAQFGKVGRFYFQIARGIDERPVEPDRETKSVGAEDTFPEDLSSMVEMLPVLSRIAETVMERLKRKGLSGRTVTLKVKYADFKQITRSKSLAHPVDDALKMMEVVEELLQATQPEGKPVRLLGITVSNFYAEEQGQLALF